MFSQVISLHYNSQFILVLNRRINRKLFFQSILEVPEESVQVPEIGL